MIRGIGPVYARKMVKAFGEKVFDVIEAEPDRLREVTGIGMVRAKRITTPGPNRRSSGRSWSFFTATGSEPPARFASSAKIQLISLVKAVFLVGPPKRGFRRAARRDGRDWSSRPVRACCQMTAICARRRRGARGVRAPHRALRDHRRRRPRRRLMKTPAPASNRPHGQDLTDGARTKRSHCTLCNTSGVRCAREG